jgi:hypothetical protein
MFHLVAGPKDHHFIRPLSHNTTPTPPQRPLTFQKAKRMFCIGRESNPGLAEVAHFSREVNGNG